MKGHHPSPPSPGKIPCAIYARVSTDQQGESIENQISQCLEYIGRLGDEYDTNGVIVYRDEGISGYYTSVFERAEMKRAIRDAKQGRFRLLVFKEISRVGRDKQENPAIIGIFEQYGVRVIAINDHYDSLNKDNITFDILSVLSEQESRKISARVSSARRQKARRGEWSGEPPIGYKINKQSKKLEIDPEWKEIPKLIFHLYVNRHMGTFKVAEYLNRHGFRTKSGRLWSRESVNKVLRNMAYVGTVVHGKRKNVLRREYDESGRMSKRKIQIKTGAQEWQIAENAHEPLIDMETFRKAQDLLSKRGRDKAFRGSLHPLTGLLVCGKCGENMVCQKRRFAGKEYRYYICKTYHKYGRSVCTQANVNADRLETFVLERLREKFSRFPKDWLHLDVVYGCETIRLEEELKEKRQNREKYRGELADLFRQRNLFDEGTYRRLMLALKQRVEAIGREIALLDEQLERMRSSGEKELVFTDKAEAFLGLHPEEWGGLRLLFHDLIGKMTLTDHHLAIEYAFDFTR